MSSHKIRPARSLLVLLVAMTMVGAACGGATTTDTRSAGEADSGAGTPTSADPADTDASGAGSSDGDSSGPDSADADASDGATQDLPVDNETSDTAPDELALVDDDDPLADVVSCDYLDSENIVIELANGSSVTSSYTLTVGYFDDAGQRVDDDTQFVSSLRPGERSIEQLYIWDVAASTCEVLAADRWEDDANAEELADVSACEITGTDTFGDVEAVLSATNSSDETSDYSITVAFIDADGVRRGTGSTYLEVVRPGESAPTDIFTTVESVDGYRCEVVSVDRSAS